MDPAPHKPNPEKNFPTQEKLVFKMKINENWMWNAP